MKILFTLLSLSLFAGELIVRKSEDRGHSEHGWLVTDYTFSFADYHDPDFMGFSDLRVINEDLIQPTKGFDTHPHDNMEILTYILSGSLEHKDTLGNTSQIHAGEFQIQSAGTGIEHSEYNPSKKTPVHLLQVWIEPNKQDITPGYQQKSFADHQEGLILVASPEGPLTLHQDARLYLGRFTSSANIPLTKTRHAWIQVTRGSLKVNGHSLEPGDGAAISQEQSLSITCQGPTEFLLFDLK